MSVAALATSCRSCREWGTLRCALHFRSSRVQPREQPRLSRAATPSTRPALSPPPPSGCPAGTPRPEEYEFVTSKRARDWLQKQKLKPRGDFPAIFAKTSAEGRDLLARMLEFDPEKRISVEEALAHPYMASLHSPDDEPGCTAAFDFSFEDGIKEESGIRLGIFQTATDIHPELQPEMDAAKAVAEAEAAAKAAAKPAAV